MDRRLRRALVRVVGATTIVVGVTVTASAVRRADQAVASGREVLMGDRLVDTFVGGDMTVVQNVETAGIVVALGDLAVNGGSLRVERASGRVFAVGGSLVVGDGASIILPAAGGLKYGTIRMGTPGSPDTVTRDPERGLRVHADGGRARIERELLRGDGHVGHRHGRRLAHHVRRRRRQCAPGVPGDRSPRRAGGVRPCPDRRDRVDQRRGRSGRRVADVRRLDRHGRTTSSSTSRWRGA